MGFADIIGACVIPKSFLPLGCNFAMSDAEETLKKLRRGTYKVAGIGGGVSLSWLYQVIASKMDSGRILVGGYPYLYGATKLIDTGCADWTFRCG